MPFETVPLFAPLFARAGGSSRFSFGDDKKHLEAHPEFRYYRYGLRVVRTSGIPARAKSALQEKPVALPQGLQRGVAINRNLDSSKHRAGIESLLQTHYADASLGIPC